MKTLADESWNSVRAWLGERALGLVLGLEPGQAPDPSDAKRWQVVHELAYSRPLEAGQPPEVVRSTKGFFLVRTLPDHDGLTFFERSRSLLGLPKLESSGDELVDALARLVFNGVLLEHLEGSEYDRFGISAAFQDPKLQEPVVGSLLADAELASLFPDRDFIDNGDGRLALAWGLPVWAPAGGGTLDVRILVGHLVESTLAEMRFLGELELGMAKEAAARTIGRLRRFADGESVAGIWLVGLTNLEVEETVEFEGWGIRPAAGLAFHGARYVSPPIRSVVWQQVECRLVRVVSNEAVDDISLGDVFAGSDEGALAANSRSRAARLALVQAQAIRETGAALAFTHPWLLSVLPNSMLGAANTVSRQSAPAKVSGDGLRSALGTADVLQDLPESVEVAVDRILGSVENDRSSADKLVDAVIAWENMFGSGGSISATISTAIAALLEPADASKRRAQFERCKKIYNLRSRVLHGELAANHPSVASAAGEALQIAIDCLILLAQDRHLSGLKDSKSRLEYLVVEAARS